MNEQTRRSAGKYADIIALPRPVTRRRRMPVTDRAKIFAPFAALGTELLPDAPPPADASGK